MEQRKAKNIALWYRLGLVAVLLVGCLAVAVGTAWARYRTDVTKSLYYQAQPLAQVYLGSVFNSTDYSPVPGSWETVDGVPTLKFMVTNSDDNGATYAQPDQKLCLRVVAGLGVWDGSEDLILQLSALEPGTDQIGTFIATATPISGETPLYGDTGEGWIFRFLDESGQELVWTLEGGRESKLIMELSAIYADLTDAGLLQLQVVAAQTQN